MNTNLNLLTTYFGLDSKDLSFSSNHNNILLQSGVTRPHQLNDLLTRPCYTKYLSSLHTPLKLNPLFITGFTLFFSGFCLDPLLFGPPTPHTTPLFFTKKRGVVWGGPKHCKIQKKKSKGMMFFTRLTSRVAVPSILQYEGGGVRPGQ